MALQAIAGGVDGYINAEQGNKQREQMLHAYDNLPGAPNLQKAYVKGYKAQLKQTGRSMDAEMKLREKYLPKQMRLAADLYAQYLPRFAGANLNTLRKVDPEFLQGRGQLFRTVSDELAQGSALQADFQAQLEDYLRGAQAARGNVLGSAPVAAEALYKGQAGQQLKQQRVENMQNFLRGPAPEDKFAALAGAGAPALSAGVAGAARPGFEYAEAPRGWGGAFYRAAADRWEMENTQEMARARMIAAAPPEMNPWLASFQQGLNSLAGSFSTSGMGAGGGSGAKK